MGQGAPTKTAFSWIGAVVIAVGACAGKADVDSADAGVGGSGPLFDAAAGSAGTLIIPLRDVAQPDFGWASCPAQEDVAVEQTDTGACEVTIQPLGTGRPFNPNHVNIEMETAEGRRVMYYVRSAVECDGLGEAGTELGWFYIDQREPARVGFCPETCRIILAEASGKVNIAFGCTTSP